jgi:hypothetical protein
MKEREPRRAGGVVSRVLPFYETVRHSRGDNGVPNGEQKINAAPPPPHG